MRRNRYVAAAFLLAVLSVVDCCGGVYLGALGFGTSVDAGDPATGERLLAIAAIGMCLAPLLGLASWVVYLARDDD